ncbi:MAG: tRNA pseudouridine(38-40) synthase TruA [Saprospirales bacterium]|nr:tRNA pseudouridine(38-40) synthase TruA [Saprospirales bacterium]
MKYFLHLAYKGTRYHGWQRQPGVLTVQEVLEDAVQRMMGKRIHCVSCGRTDAGVHASQYFCHIVVEEPFDFDPVFRLNKMLPDDISIFDCIEVPRNAHAQTDALSRTYTYHIHTRKNALLSDLSAYYPAESLDVEQLKAAAALLPPHRNFRAMCMPSDENKTKICEVSEAYWTVGEEEYSLRFQITANRFLKGMVRILVANMLEVGYGRLSLEDFEQRLKSEEPAPQVRSAYPQGLYLSGVKYSYL